MPAGMAMRRVPQAKRAERARLLRQRIDSAAGSIRRLYKSSDYSPPRGSLSPMLTRTRTTILFASAVAFMQGRP